MAELPSGQAVSHVASNTSYPYSISQFTQEGKKICLDAHAATGTFFHASKTSLKNGQTTCTYLSVSILNSQSQNCLNTSAYEYQNDCKHHESLVTPTTRKPPGRSCLLWESQRSSEEELRELREAQRQTQEELSEADFLIIRASILDDWAENRHFEFDDNRNAMVHGGKIQADVKKIRLFSSREPDRVTKWKTVFQISYDVM